MKVLIVHSIVKVAVELVKWTRAHMLFAETSYTTDPTLINKMLETKGIDLLIISDTAQIPDELRQSRKNSRNFEIIMTAPTDRSAILAFKIDCLDYLLEPVMKENLQASLNKFKRKYDLHRDRSTMSDDEKVKEQLNYYLKSNGHIALPTSDGFKFLERKKIVFCKSEGNYTRISIEGKGVVVLCRPIGEVKRLLKEDKFIRVHQSYLVNADYVDKYIKNDGGYLLLSTGDRVPVSRRNREIISNIISSGIKTK